MNEQTEQTIREALATTIVRLTAENEQLLRRLSFQKTRITALVETAEDAAYWKAQYTELEEGTDADRLDSAEDMAKLESENAELREQLEKMTGERDEADKLVTYLRTGKDELRKECDRLTDSNKALKLALELKQLNSPDVAELKKEIRQLQDQNDELTRMCAPDPDIPPVHVKTAEEIAMMCEGSNRCGECGNAGAYGIFGTNGCKFAVRHTLPSDWYSDDLDAVNAIIKFATDPETAK